MTVLRSQVKPTCLLPLQYFEPEDKCVKTTRLPLRMGKHPFSASFEIRKSSQAIQNLTYIQCLKFDDKSPPYALFWWGEGNKAMSMNITTSLSK